jgi:signal transduction histidine kinase
MLLHLINFILKRKSQGQIRLSVQHDNEKATIQVAACETIISSEEMGELFELVVNVDAAGHSSMGKGGLTLPLVYRLAQRQQGKLWVTSQADSGTSFYLQLPLHQVG